MHAPPTRKYARLPHSIAVVVVFTEPRKDTIRVISARKANRNEQEKYYEKII